MFLDFFPFGDDGDQQGNRTTADETVDGRGGADSGGGSDTTDEWKGRGTEEGLGESGDVHVTYEKREEPSGSDMADRGEPLAKEADPWTDGGKASKPKKAARGRAGAKRGAAKKAPKKKPAAKARKAPGRPAAKKGGKKSAAKRGATTKKKAMKTAAKRGGKRKAAPTKRSRRVPSSRRRTSRTRGTKRRS